MLETKIEIISKRFLESSRNKDILIIVHYGTDGISSAAIIIQTLKKLDKKFSVKIVKKLEKEFISNLPKDKIIFFLDLNSNNLENISQSNLMEIFVIDHHNLKKNISPEINIINPELENRERLSSSVLTYLFCKQINPENQELSKLAILGMVGDSLEKEINNLSTKIPLEKDISKVNGILISPSTRPLNRTLEYSSNPYIPGVTGNSQGVFELLKEIKLNPENGKYKSLIELNEEESSRLLTAIMLRNPNIKNEEIIGEIFLIKTLKKLEDAKEISTMINTYSKMGKSGLAIQFCLGNSKAKKELESSYTKYKQLISSGLNFISETEKITGKGFIIINAKNKIKSNILGTLTKIISNSSIYEEGTIISAMVHCNKEIKISSRNVGNKGRNVREILNKIINEIGGKVEGNEFAASCLIEREKEKNFLELFKKNLEIELIKI